MITPEPQMNAPTMRAPASPAVAVLRDIFAQERDALRTADIEALVLIQETKKRAVDALYEQGISGEVLSELGLIARSNLKLMRHLLNCLHGIVTSDEGMVYGAKGNVQLTKDVSRKHGAA